MRVTTLSGGAPFLSSAQPATTSKPATAVAAKIETQTGTRLFESMKRNPFRDTSKDMIHTTGRSIESFESSRVDQTARVVSRRTGIEREFRPIRLGRQPQLLTTERRSDQQRSERAIRSTSIAPN